MSAHDLARSTYADAVASGDLATRGEAAIALSWLCMMLGQTEEGIAFARVARAIVSATGDRNAEGRARAALSWLLSQVGDPDAVDEAERGVAAADAGGDPASRCVAGMAAGIVYATLRQSGPALRHLGNAARLAALANDPVLGGRVALNRGVVRARTAEERPDLGDEAGRLGLDEAASITREAFAVAMAAGDGWAARIALCNLAEFLAKAGRATDGCALLDRHDDLGGETGAPDRAHLDHARALCRIAEARFDEAEAALRRCLGHCDQGNWTELRVLATADLSTALAGQGRFEEAYETHRRFHSLYQAESADGAQRRARAIAIEHEMEALTRDLATTRRRAEALARTNATLAARTDLLLRHSLEDSLTGLPNRRRLDQDLAVLSDADEPQGGYAIAMIDIDHFKRVNDTLSHETGDRVLRTVARLLRDELRAPDVVARYGGEEFTAVIRSVDPVHATLIGERLRLAVRDHAWDALVPGLRVTVSIGIALDEEDADARSVLALADARLRLAKEAGRDRVVAEVRARRPDDASPRPEIVGLH